MCNKYERYMQQRAETLRLLALCHNPHFHPNSYGFRPGRNAHHAMHHAQATIRQATTKSVQA